MKISALFLYDAKNESGIMDQEGENIDIYRMAGYPVGLV